jgi:hypothetical protein
MPRGPSHRPRLVGITAEALILIAVDSCMRQRHLALATTRSGSIVPNHETWRLPSRPMGGIMGICELAARPSHTHFWPRLTLASFEGKPHMTRGDMACLMDTIGNDHYGALLHDPIGVAA